MRRPLILAGLVLAALPAPAMGASNVATWGDNTYGQLGDGHTPTEQLFSDAPVAAIVEDATAVAEGSQFDLALLSNGTVKAWGRDNRGQLCNGTESWEGVNDTPSTIAGLNHVKEIAAGTWFSMFRTESGEVYVCGEWPAGLGKTTPYNVGLAGIEHIAAGDGVNQGSTAYAVNTSGTVYAWGFDGQWQLGYPEAERDISLTPLPVEHLAKASVGVAAGARFAASLISGGGVEVWGGNHYAEHGRGTEWPYGEYTCFGDYENCAANNERAPSTASVTTVSELAASGVGAVALTENGEAVSWGTELAAHSESPARVASEAAGVAMRNGHTAVLLKNGTVLARGLNARGSLGDGAPTGAESCANPETEKTEPCQRNLQTVSGFTEAPTRLTASALALARAPGPTFRTLSQWTSSGSLTIAKLGATLSLGGHLTGRDAVHGQASGELGTATEKLPTKLFGMLPITLGIALDKAPAQSGPEIRSVLHVSSIGILNLTLPANCTSEPLTMNSETPFEAGSERLDVSGTLTVPAFHCDGEWLPEPFGSVLTMLVSGSGNSYELALEG